MRRKSFVYKRGKKSHQSKEKLQKVNDLQEAEGQEPLFKSQTGRIQFLKNGVKLNDLQ